MKTGVEFESGRMSEAPPAADAPSSAAVRDHVDRILSSPAFQSSKRCKQFLDYVCTRHLAGDDDALKERTIAIEVFGRRPQSDLAEDTIVRVTARELRKRLAHFYATPEGAALQIRLELPTGSYCPQIHFAASAHSANPLTTVAGQVEIPAKSGQKNTRAFWALLSLLVLVAISAVTTLVKSRQSPAAASSQQFARFWQPVLNSKDPFLLAVPHPLVYHPSHRALKMNEDALGPLPLPYGQRPLRIDPSKLNGNDMVPVTNQYVGFGDLVAATQISTMLARRSKEVRVRMANSVPFEDLRHGGALLIGATTNRWAMELQQTWRFQFVRTTEPRTLVVDMADKATLMDSRRHWAIQSQADGSATEDFIVISRILNSETGGILLAAAGLKQFGTEAAGQLISDPDQWDRILRTLPAGWETRNLQVVLHAKVIGNAPAQPEVVAWHVW